MVKLQGSCSPYCGASIPNEPFGLLSVSSRAVESVHKCSDSDSFIKAQYALIMVNL
jgi:hypothetical protein